MIGILAALACLLIGGLLFVMAGTALMSWIMFADHRWGWCALACGLLAGCSLYVAGTI